MKKKKKMKKKNASVDKGLKTTKKKNPNFDNIVWNFFKRKPNQLQNKIWKKKKNTYSGGQFDVFAVVHVDVAIPGWLVTQI